MANLVSDDRLSRQNGYGPQSTPADFSRSPASEGAGFARDSLAQISHAQERRSREWSASVRMVEQHRRALLSAEKRRDASFRRFADVEAIVQEAGENLKTATSNYNKNAAELDPVLDKTWDAIQELENASATLATDFLFWRSSWEQYEQARRQAQKLQEDFASDQDSQFKSPLG